MKSFFLSIVFSTFVLLAFAQHSMTLKEAVETGIKNNIDVLQADLQMQKAVVDMKQSKEYMLPNLNANINYGKNFGRSIDPFTNSYIDQKVNFANSGASSNLLLFNGFYLQNQVKANKLGYDASKMELQQAKDNLTINIILDYLQVLSAEEILKQSQDQVLLTQKQVERLGILNQSGAILPADFFDMKGQLATDQIAIADSKNSLAVAKLNLVQLLNIPYDKNLELEKIPAENFNLDYSGTPDEIYQTALQQFAQVQATKFRTQSAEKNISSIKGKLFPTLSLGGSINTNYSSVASRDYFVNSTESPSSNYVNVNGSQYPVIVKHDNYNSKKINFGDQLSNNLFSAVGIGLTIPLFNASHVRNQVKLAKLDLKNYEYIEQNTKTQLQQAIERAYVNLTSALDKYKLLLEQENAFTESFRSAEVRFNAGAITSVDYLIAKNNLNRAQNNLITSKYDFVLREKVLDYYSGKPLW
ncbi:MAG: TolC family protein [Ginsengibacter sp.]